MAFHPYTKYFLACALVQASFFSIQSHGETVLVEVRGNNTFSPRDVVIRQGDTVQWDWKGGSHNVVSGTSSADPQSGVLFRSGNQTRAPFTFFVTFDDMGVFPYYCLPHESSNMKGTVTVEAASGAEGEGGSLPIEGDGEGGTSPVEGEGEGSQSTEGQAEGGIEGSAIGCAPGHGDTIFGESAGLPGDVSVVLLAVGMLVLCGSRRAKCAT